MKTLKTLTLLALVLVISAFAVNVVKEKSSGYTIGDQAADFQLRNVDGTMVSLKDYETAAGFIVIFTSNTCPFSMANENRINALARKYNEKGYPVIAINPNTSNGNPGDSFEAMQQRAKEKGFTFPYLQDKEQEVYPEYGATKTPQVYVLQKDKKNDVIVKYIGAIDNNSRDPKGVTEKYLEKAVDALLAGEEIEIKETKAIGCAIKS